MRETKTSYKNEFFRPDRATWWLYCLLLAVGTCGISIVAAKRFMAAQEALWILAPLFLITLSIFIALPLIVDPYRARRWWVLLAALIIGGSMATYVSFLANEKVIYLSVQLLPDGVGMKWAAAIAGPAVEEWAKMLMAALVLLIASRTMTRPIHGFLVGAFVGIGFQIFENVFYAANSALSNANSNLFGALSVTVMRSLIGVSSHWLYSAIVGVGVALLLGRTVQATSLGKRIAGFCFFYFLGWGAHFLWNSPVADNNMLIPILWGARIVAILALAYFVGRWVLTQERLYLQQRLDALTAESSDGDKYADDDLVSAIRPRKERRAVYKRIKRNENKAAVKELKSRQTAFLDVLQGYPIGTV